MSSRPTGRRFSNANAPGRGRGGGGRGGGRGGGGGGRGEQRWWDAAWRAEHFRQKESEVELFDGSVWMSKIKEMQSSDAPEIIIKHNFRREDQQALSDIASGLGLNFHAYNKGKTLVVSKVPLPNYRADLDERHGSTQKEIRMSTDVERRVGSLLSTSYGPMPVENTSYKSNNSLSMTVPNANLPTLNSQGSQHSDMGISNHTFVSRKVTRVNTFNDAPHRQEKTKGSGAKILQPFREKLPAFKMKSEFLNRVTDNQVLVVSGETGCGKTTQLPQFILEESIERCDDCQIICTQPRRISAISVASRVSLERGENIGETVGYHIRLEAKRCSETKLLFCTTGILLRQLVQDPDLSGVTHLLVDEIHERGMNEDFLLIILRELLKKRTDLRLILMSATINADMFSKYFGNAPIIHIPGFAFPVTEFFLEDVLEKTGYMIKSEFDKYPGSRRRQSDSKKDPLSLLFESVDINSQYINYSSSTRNSLKAWSGLEIDLGLVEATIEYICRSEGPGAVLVFLTGWDDISKLVDIVKTNRFIGDPNKFLILPLHGSMPTIDQREIFERPPNNMRKIVLATNIAETSITIDDVVFVIDCGKAKETSYDALNKLACLLPSWISKASSHQRRGRAGRVQPGICYRLYPKVVHSGMPEYQLPEILRTPLQQLCLHIKSIGLGDIKSFLGKALQPPDPLSIQNAIELLITIEVLNDNEQLTPLGRHLCVLPLDPNIGKMLLMGCIFQCLDPILTIAAALSHRDPFVLPLSRKEEADAAKRALADNCYSDHIALLNAFDGWKAAKKNNNDRAFCWDNFLSSVTLRMLDEMRTQFLDLLSDIGFVHKSKGVNAYNKYGKDLGMVCAVMCAGLYPNVLQCKRKGKRSDLYSKEVGKVDLHPGSVNAGVRLFPLPYMIYSEKVKSSSIFVRDSTNISDYALLMFGGALVRSKNGDGIEMLGGYLHFSASKHVLKLIQRLRGKLDELLGRKISDPGFDISAEGMGVVAAVVELLHSCNLNS